MSIFKYGRKKYPLVRQYDRTDCGPAALLSVLKYHGGNDNLVHVRKLCRTSTEGTTIFDMVIAATKLGFESKGLRGNYENLQKAQAPVIVHVILECSYMHYMVVYKVKESSLLLGDPAKGLIKLSRKNFEKIWISKALILLKPSLELHNQIPPHWLKWISSYFKQESIWINQSVFLGFVYTFFGLITAVLIERLFDDYIPAKDIQRIRYVGILLTFILLTRASAGFLREKFLVILNRRLSKTLNNEFLEHLFKLPKHFFDTRRKGDIIARFHDIVRIQQAIIKISGTTIIDILIITGALILLFYFSSLIGLIILGFLPVYTFILLLYSQPLNKLQSDVMKNFANVESTYIDSLEGVDDILNFNVSDSFASRNKFIFGLYQDKIEKLGFTRTCLSFFAEISGALITTVILIIGASGISQDQIKLGELIACYSLLSYIIPSINRSIEANISFQGAFVAIRRLRDLLLVEEENDTGNELFEMKKALKIRQAQFSWSANKQLFQDLEMQIPKGKIVSLWGPSGVGKSTLVQIIHRKYDLEQGKILLDETSVNNIKLDNYRKNVAIVPQQVKIFNGTIGDNIRLGRPTSELPEQMEMIMRYGFSNFFSRFEHGIYTRIGEDGRILSGGEKQVVGLARALYDRPEILIIDEGITSLDRETETMILRILSKYVLDHAVLINTHSLRIILKTDFLYVMKNGSIIQKGNPVQLLRSEGYFNSIYDDKFSFNTG